MSSKSRNNFSTSNSSNRFRRRTDGKQIDRVMRAEAVAYFTGRSFALTVPRSVDLFTRSFEEYLLTTRSRKRRHSLIIPKTSPAKMVEVLALESLIRKYDLENIQALFAIQIGALSDIQLIRLCAQLTTCTLVNGEPCFETRH